MIPETYFEGYMIKQYLIDFLTGVIALMTLWIGLAYAARPVTKAVEITYYCKGVAKADYGQYTIVLERPHDAPVSKDGRRIARTWMDIRTFGQADLRAAMKPGAKVTLTISQE
jgi:hypothetical protein